MSQADAQIGMANILQGLHKNWMPHETQAQVLYEIFYNGKTRIGIECGRKWGKTDIVCYILWRILAHVRNADGYYFAPTAKQSKELIWANNRVQTFGPKRFLAGKPNETELRMRFKSQSFLKVDGSESYEAYRGVEPDIFVYDEYKDFHTKFHPAMDPNRAAKAGKGMGIHIVVGTPPEVDSHPDDPDRTHPFYELMDEIKEDPDGAYFNFSSFGNPHISHDFIRKQRDKYEKRGDLAGFMREYMAKRVKGGPGAIIPMFDQRQHVHPHDKMMQDVVKDFKHLEWYVIADPGTETVFGMLFAAVNPYTKKVFILDEIYAKKQEETSTGKIIPAMRKIRDELNPLTHNWVGIYDEAGAWFCNEASFSYNEPFMPTHKAWDKKTSGLSLIKDQLLNGLALISDRCKHLIWEIENYQKDKNGRIPKKNDHLIDCWRYLNYAAGICLVEDEIPESPDPDDQRSSFTPEDDIETERLLDPDAHINNEDDYYYDE